MALTVTVKDEKGDYVGNLGVEDFGVFEDGVRQTVELFGAGEVPVDLLLMLDTSASMRVRLDMAKQAAVNVITAVGPSDRAAVMSFGARTQLVAPLTNDRASLQEAVGGLRAGGTTPLYNALYVGLKQFGLSPSGELRRRAIIVLSDGDDNASLVSFDAVMDLARRAGIAVYVIALSVPSAARVWDPPGGGTQAYQMRTLARETGAQSFFPDTVDGLSGVYDGIARELAQQYAIGYVRTEGAGDRRFRRLAVVVNHPGARVRTRSGYLPGG